jgi:hypothetical protein
MLKNEYLEEVGDIESIRTCGVVTQTSSQSPRAVPSVPLGGPRYACSDFMFPRDTLHCS